MADLNHAYLAVRKALQAADKEIGITVTGSGLSTGSGDIWLRMGETEFFIEVKRATPRMSRA